MWPLKIKCKLQLHIWQEEKKNEILPTASRIMCRLFHRPKLLCSYKYCGDVKLVMRKKGELSVLTAAAGGAVGASRPKISTVFRIVAASNPVNMASALGRLARLSALGNAHTARLSPRTGPGRTVTPSRSAVWTSSGAVLPKPKKVSVAFKGRCGVCKYQLSQPLRTRHELTWLSLWSGVCVAPGGADPLRPCPDCSGSGALLVCGDSDQQELCCAAGGARYLRPRGWWRWRLRAE